MKTTALLFIAASSIVFGPTAFAQTAAQATTIEEILVVVNNHIITRQGLQQAVEQQYAELYRRFSGKELDEKLKDAREKTLQEMIDEFVLLDVATEKELMLYAPSDADILENLKSSSGLTSDSELETAIKSELGLSLSEFIRQRRQSTVIWELLSMEVYRKVPVEEQEARLYYNEHQVEYQKSARFRIREMIIPKGATPPEQATAEETVAKVQDEIKNGASFESLVSTYSNSPSKGTGGDLGWVEKGLLLKAIEDAAIALKPDEIGGPIETDKDFILIQLIAADLDGVKPFESVKGDIIRKLQEPKAENAKMHYLQSQRLRANIRYIVPKEQIIKG
ncbi:MAG: peptidylprolyl isomerase [Holophagales bacterium]|nr:peptidylprolyl isomerase [Holophagales bacterium]